MPATRTDSNIGVIGRYELLTKLGAGNMGTVYKARHRDTKAIVAIKTLLPHIARNPVLAQRFEREFLIAGKLDHPNVVRVLEYSDRGETPYLVMEFVAGESLGKKIEREGRLSEAEAVRLIVQVGHGLHAAHSQGLIHRDIKPDNIMVTPDGVAKIMDLGLAKDLDDPTQLTRSGGGLGTPNYMAPEQFRNAKNASIRCDIYSLAATLYHLITGEEPFGDGDSIIILMRKMRNELTPPSRRVPDLSPRVGLMIKLAMNADPEQRPASCQEFTEGLIDPADATGLSADPRDTDLWYAVYEDAAGEVWSDTGSTNALSRAIREGKLGNVRTIRVSKSKVGPFHLLEQYPEFRGLATEEATLEDLSTQPTVPAMKLTVEMNPPRENPGSLDTVPVRQQSASPTTMIPPAPRPTPSPGRSDAGSDKHGK